MGSALPAGSTIEARRDCARGKGQNTTPSSSEAHGEVIEARYNLPLHTFNVFTCTFAIATLIWFVPEYLAEAGLPSWLRWISCLVAVSVGFFALFFGRRV